MTIQKYKCMEHYLNDDNKRKLNSVAVVDRGDRLAVDFTTDCKRENTAVKRMERFFDNHIGFDLKVFKNEETKKYESIPDCGFWWECESVIDNVWYVSVIIAKYQIYDN